MTNVGTQEPLGLWTVGCTKLATSQLHTRLPCKLGHAVAQLVEALHYKPKGREFDSRLCNWNFSLT
jgi:hypothetical protein